MKTVFAKKNLSFYVINVSSHWTLVYTQIYSFLTSFNRDIHRDLCPQWSVYSLKLGTIVNQIRLSSWRSLEITLTMSFNENKKIRFKMININFEPDTLKYISVRINSNIFIRHHCIVNFSLKFIPKNIVGSISFQRNSNLTYFLCIILIGESVEIFN